MKRPRVTLDEFRSLVVELPQPLADATRAQFIETFVDTSTDFYREHVAAMRLFADGYAYTAYLWDVMSERRFGDAAVALDFLSTKDGRVRVFWDLHSSERILILDYWKFRKDAVLECYASDLLAGLSHLPEDLYICDPDMSWAVALTHEEVDGVPWAVIAMPHAHPAE